MANSPQPKAVSSYCQFVQLPGADPLHRSYHDHLYGFPLADDDELFGRLILEINQAGLSWETILRRQEAFRRAYDGFSIERIASYSQGEVDRLMGDAGIIRNRKKIEAAIHNAGVVLELRRQHGSFGAWLDSQVGRERSEWVALFRRTFRFTGPEITAEFLMSTGYLAGAHREDCPIHERIIKSHPPYLKAR